MSGTICPLYGKCGRLCAEGESHSECGVYRTNRSLTQFVSDAQTAEAKLMDIAPDPDYPTLTNPTHDTCPTCVGKRDDPTDCRYACPTCHGTGSIEPTTTHDEALRALESMTMRPCSMEEAERASLIVAAYIAKLLTMHADGSLVPRPEVDALAVAAVAICAKDCGFCAHYDPAECEPDGCSNYPLRAALAPFVEVGS